jgi:hypothetical protein
MTYDPTWVRTSPILVPQAIQNNAITAQKGSVRLDALEWGQRVGETALDTNQGGSSAITATPLNNGKMFIAWGAGTNGRFAIVDPDGNMDSTAYQVFETSFLDYATGLTSTLLPNGNVALAYGQNQGANEALVLKIYDENGDVVRDAVTVKEHASETQWGVGLAALPDGSIVVTWNEASAGNMSYFAIYDLDGDVRKGYTSLGGDYGIPQAAPLSDGNWIVTYENSGVRFRTYDRMGIQIVGETLFRTGVTQAGGLRTMGNGQVVIPFTRGFGIIDRHGNVVVAPEVKEGSGTYSVAVLPHDNIVTQNNQGTTGYYKVYDYEGNLLNSQITYASDAASITAGDVATFKNGNFALVYTTSGNNVKLYVHQGTKAGFGGDLEITGNFSLNAGTTVNEISTDGTLSDDSDDALITEKAAKAYVDAQIGVLSQTKIEDGDSSVEVIDDGTTSPQINFTIDNSVAGAFTTNGFILDSTGSAVTIINNDAAMGGYNGLNGSQTALVTEYAARQYVDDLMADTSEPTGFSQGNDNTYSTVGVDGTDSFYIEPTADSFDIFLTGQRWRITEKHSVTISDVEGMHYIYFDDDGVLKESVTWDIAYIYSKAYVSAVYWDATNKQIIYRGDERHGATMDGKTHINLHVYRGTLYRSGLAVGDITADSTGTENAEAQFSVTAGMITDEDIDHTIPSHPFPANMPMFYLSGSGQWRVDEATDYPLINTGSGRMAYNDFSGTWSLTEAASGSYVLTHVFATNDPTKPVVGIVGQAEYTTLSAARLGATDEINALVIGTMPFAEFKPIATVIYETNDSFTNTPKAAIRTNDEGSEWTDWRNTGISSVPGSITAHSSLSGLENDDHTQYLLVNGGRDVAGSLGIDDNLTVGNSVTVENDISVTSGTFSLPTGTSVDEISTDGTMVDASDDAIPTEGAVKSYVDTAIANLNPDKIWEGDSYVEVVDDGTSAGYIEVVADGVQVAYWDSEATSQRFGKAPVDGGFSLVTADASAIIQDTSGNNILNLTQDVQTIGLSGDTYLQTTQTTNTVVGSANGTDVFNLTDTVQRLGASTDTHISVNGSTTDTVTVTASTTEVASLGTTTQRIGQSGDSRLTLDSDTDTVELYAGTTSVLNGTPTIQRFGATGDTNLTLNNSADTFTLSAGANTQISGTTTTLDLGVAGDTTIVLNQTNDSVAITAGGESQILVETSGTSVWDDLTVTGNLFVDGTTFTVHNTEVRTADNVITLNYGEPGNGVTDGTAGIEIDRGSQPNYEFIFAEQTDTFRIGEEGETQAVATREDNPEDGRMAYWNETERRFDTAGDTFIWIDTTGGGAVVTDDQVEALSIDEFGITLENGTSINEFSTDGTLGDNSDDAVPTEKAVKTYVDSIAGSQSYKIFADDSYVQVIDDGTATGYVEIVTDSVQVAYFDPESSTQRIGKLAESRMLVSDDQIQFYTGSTPTLNMSLGTNGLTLASGATVNAISTDSALGSSDTTLITQAAATTYIDAGDTTTLINAQVYADAGDAATLSSAQSYADGGDATTLSSAQSYADGGDASTLAAAQSYDATTLIEAKAYADAGDAATLSAAQSYADAGDATALLDANAYADAGDASTLSSANSYTDVEIEELRNEMDIVNMKTVTADSTAVTGDVILVDTTAGDVNIDLVESEDARIIIKKKTTDGNKVNITTSPGTIDGQNLIVVDTPYQSFTFISDGSNFYII